MSKQGFTFELTGIIVPDESTGQFTAFFAEFPEALACGDSEEEAHNNLLNIFTVMLQDKKGEVIRDYLPQQNYITKDVKMVVA